MTGSVVALGTFDGVHIGHAAIIRRALDVAKTTGLEPVIYTFTGHPMAAFGKQPALLMSDRERLDALSRLCRVETDDFDVRFAATSPESFVEMLRTRLDMRCAVAGFNYTFGARGAGNTALLEKLGGERGFDVFVAAPVLYEKEPVSSTRIRRALEAGNVSEAAEMLERPYSLSGRVRADRGIGRSIGFPTANLEGFEGRVVPGDGVYATLATVAGETYPAVTNVGRNPTVHGGRLSVETHIIGFSRDIYGESLRVEFVEWLRGESDFGSVEALRERIALDAQNAESMLKKAR